MGKILDIITILFKGDTSDLEKKKKEAAKAADDVNKSIKDQKSNLDSVGTSLDTNLKRLETTLGVASNLDEKFVAIGNTLAGIAATAEPFPVVEKARKQSEEINKNLS